MKPGKKIYPIDWLGERPYGRMSEADAYYAGVATLVYRVLDAAEMKKEVFKTDDMTRRAAMALTGLFEDIISGIGTWDLVVSESLRRYGRLLPFYGASGYHRGEINLQDVQLMLWDLCQSCRDHSVINPENPMLFSVAHLVYDIFDAEYEYAVENEQLKAFLTDPAMADDYWMVRHRLEWLLQSSFLNHRFMSGMPGVVDSLKEDRVVEEIGLEKALYSHQVDQLFKFRSNLLSMRCGEILGSVCGCDAEGKMAAMRLLPMLAYRLEGITSSRLLLRRECDGERFFVELDSFGDLDTERFQPKKTILSSCLVNFGKQWYQAGLTSILIDGHRFSEEDLAVQRLSLGGKATETLQKAARKALKGKDFAIFSSFEKLQGFVKNALGIDLAKDPDAHIKEDGQFILTYNDNTGIALSHGFCHCIATDENPWYDKEKADKDAIAMIVEPGAVTYEFSCYLLDNDLLPDARLESIHGLEYGRRFVRDNGQFLADFFHHRYRGD